MPAETATRPDLFGERSRDDITILGYMAHYPHAKAFITHDLSEHREQMFANWL
jgi:hypothetical protein